MRFPATPGWGPPAVVVCSSPSLLTSVCRLRWGVWGVGVSLVVCVLAARAGRAVLCVACLGFPRRWWCGVVVWRGCVLCVRWCAWLRVCGVPVVRGLLSPPLLVGACGWCLCGCGWCVVWVPRHSRLGSAVVWWWLVPCHSWLRVLVRTPPLLGGVRRRVRWLVPRHSWLRAVGVLLRHYWLGCIGCGGGGPLATPGFGPRGALLLSPGVCVCAVWCFVLVWVACGGVVAVCVCVFLRAVCGLWAVSYLGWFSSLVGMVVAKRQKKSERGGPVDV